MPLLCKESMTIGIGNCPYIPSITLVSMAFSVFLFTDSLKHSGFYIKTLTLNPMTPSFTERFLL